MPAGRLPAPASPGIISVPLGFLGCWLGTVLSREEAKSEVNFDELWVRSETGLGAEVAGEAGLTGRPVAQPGKVPASAM